MQYCGPVLLHFSKFWYFLMSKRLEILQEVSDDLPKNTEKDWFRKKKLVLRFWGFGPKFQDILSVRSKSYRERFISFFRSFAWSHVSINEEKWRSRIFEKKSWGRDFGANVVKNRLFLDFLWFSKSMHQILLIFGAENNIVVLNIHVKFWVDTMSGSWVITQAYINFSQRLVELYAG